MKKLIMMIVLLLCMPLIIWAQEEQYNKKGDIAMQKHDYSDARMWYEVGVQSCDIYSINKITEIWLGNQNMRKSMYSLMAKCLDCLTVKAGINDITAMNQLITYYTKGIGTLPNEDLASYWKKRIEDIENPTFSSIENDEKNKKEKRMMRVFFSYSFAPDNPLGITLGMLGERWGWYARVRSNMNFLTKDAVCNDQELVGDKFKQVAYQFDDKKVCNTTFSAGMLVPLTSKLVTSFGLGYGKHDLNWHYKTINYTDGKENTGWALNEKSSISGIVADVDLMYKVKKKFYVSLGCYTLNFKQVDASVGVGIIF